MKTELRLAPHTVLPGAKVIEIWYDDQLLGTITGRDGRPGVRVLTKYPIMMVEIPGVPTVIEVGIQL